MLGPLRPRWQVKVIHTASNRVVDNCDAFYRYNRAVRETNTINSWLWRHRQLQDRRAIVVDRFPHRNLPRI